MIQRSLVELAAFVPAAGWLLVRMREPVPTDRIARADLIGCEGRVAAGGGNLRVVIRGNVVDGVAMGPGLGAPLVLDGVPYRLLREQDAIGWFLAPLDTGEGSA